MGGYGSGQWRASTRATVEDSLTLDGYVLIPKMMKQYAGNVTWSRNGHQTARIGYTRDGETITLDYSCNGEPVKYPVRLTETGQPKGGLRYWFICPARNCGRRSAKLYLPSGGKIFACRECYNLTYTSCNESRKWDSMFSRLAMDTGLPVGAVKRAMKEMW